MAKKLAILVSVVCIVALAVGIRWFIRARSQSAYADCIVLLKQIDGAKATWAFEHKKQDSDVPTWADLLGHDRYIRAMPVCPQGGSYTLGPVAERPRCSLITYRHSLADMEPAAKGLKQSQ